MITKQQIFCIMQIVHIRPKCDFFQIFNPRVKIDGNVSGTVIVTYINQNHQWFIHFKCPMAIFNVQQCRDFSSLTVSFLTVKIHTPDCRSSYWLQTNWYMLYTLNYIYHAVFMTVEIYLSWLWGPKVLSTHNALEGHWRQRLSFFNFFIIRDTEKLITYSDSACQITPKTDLFSTPWTYLVFTYQDVLLREGALSAGMNYKAFLT